MVGWAAAWFGWISGGKQDLLGQEILISTGARSDGS
jgi:hypothetical protein